MKRIERDEFVPYDEDDSLEGAQSTLRQLVIRIVAFVLLLSFLGTVYLSLRGVEDIAIVVAILAGVGLIAVIAKKQREAEDPYRSDDPADPEIH